MGSLVSKSVCIAHNSEILEKVPEPYGLTENTKIRNLNADMNPHLYGFKITQFLELHNWKIFPIDGTIPFDTEELCPSDATQLKTICTLVGNEGAQKMRIGCCSHCGYTGYIDRPKKEWIKNFYLKVWSDGESRNVAEEVAELLSKNAVSKDRMKRITETIRFLEDRQIGKDRSICEIGCGYGSILKRLKDLGFTRLIGIENSTHRAEIVRTAYGIPVIAAPFEDPEAEEKLRSLAPYALMFSHHVLEHTYHPGEIMEKISGLQQNGDYIIFSLPNGIGEFSMSPLLYLPHLHSFTPQSLKNLFARYGYEVIDDSLTTDWELYMIARKTGLVVSGDRARDYVPAMREKFIRYFGLNRAYSTQERLLWWSRRVDIAGQMPWYQSGFLRKLQWAAVTHFVKYFHKQAIIRQLGAKRFQSRHPFMSAKIEGLSRRHTVPEESPLEIQFEGPIVLGYK